MTWRAEWVRPGSIPREGPLHLPPLQGQEGEREAGTSRLRGWGAAGTVIALISGCACVLTFAVRVLWSLPVLVFRVATLGRYALVFIFVVLLLLLLVKPNPVGTDVDAALVACAITWWLAATRC